MLPLRELNVLANIKAELIQRMTAEDAKPTVELEGRWTEPERKSPDWVLHVTPAPSGWQRMCRARHNSFQTGVVRGGK